MTGVCTLWLIRTKTFEKGRALSLAIPHASREAAVFRPTVIRKLGRPSLLGETRVEKEVKDITHLITINIITTRVIPPAVLWRMSTNQVTYGILRL